MSKYKSEYQIWIGLFLKTKEAASKLLNDISGRVVFHFLSFGSMLFDEVEYPSKPKKNCDSYEIYFKVKLPRQPTPKDIMDAIDWLNQFIPVEEIKADFLWERENFGRIGEYEWENSTLKFWRHKEWNQLSKSERKAHADTLKRVESHKWKHCSLDAEVIGKLEHILHWVKPKK